MTSKATVTANNKKINQARAAFVDQVQLALGKAQAIASELNSPLVSMGLSTARKAMVSSDLLSLAGKVVTLKEYLVEPVNDNNATDPSANDSHFTSLVDHLAKVLGVTEQNNFSQQYGFPSQLISLEDRELLLEYLNTAVELAEDYLAVAVN